MKAAALALLVVGPAVGGDFRTLDFGEKCDNLESMEAAFGSRPVEWPKLDQSEMHAFDGTAFEREVTIGYLCSDGRLLTGNYFFPFEDRQTAVASFEAVHKQLSRIYGTPRVYEPGDLGARWKTPRVWIQANVMSLREEQPKRFRLVILFGRTTSP